MCAEHTCFRACQKYLLDFLYVAVIDCEVGLSRVAGVIVIGLCKFALCMSATVINKN